MKKVDLFIVQKIINALTKYQLFRAPALNNAEYHWQKLFDKGKTKSLFKLTGDIELFLYKDSLLSKLIYDGFENEEKTFIKKFLKKGDLFFDIGANIGLHTLIASEIIKHGGHIYSFEPYPQTYQRLNENIMQNNIENIVSSFQFGISNKNEKLNLNISNDGYDAWNSFADLKHVPFESQIEVDVIRLDSFIAEKNIDYNKISLIKIDVEGWELNVLEGIETLFDKPDFNACFLTEFTEENVFRAGYSCKDLYNYMLNKGYEWFNYDLEINTVKPAPLKAYYPYENLVAIKERNIQDVKNRLAI